MTKQAEDGNDASSDANKTHYILTVVTLHMFKSFLDGAVYTHTHLLVHTHSSQTIWSQLRWFPPTGRGPSFESDRYIRATISALLCCDPLDCLQVCTIWTRRTFVENVNVKCELA